MSEQYEESFEAGYGCTPEPSEHVFKETPNVAQISPYESKAECGGQKQVPATETNNETSPNHVLPAPAELDGYVNLELVERTHRDADGKESRRQNLNLPPWSKKFSFCGVMENSYPLARVAGARGQEKPLGKDDGSLMDSYSGRLPLPRWNIKTMLGGGDSFAVNDRGRQEHLGLMASLNRGSSSIRPRTQTDHGNRLGEGVDET